MTKRARYVDRPLPTTEEEWLARAREQAERFWSKVAKSGPSHPYDPDLGRCWPWVGGKIDKDGYGRFSVTGRGPRFPGDRPVQKNIGAHKLAWQLSNNVVPVGMVVMHSCDNPPCCNPEHSAVGTVGDNRADCVAKGRGAIGEANGNSVLTLDQVLAIRELARANYGAKAISTMLELPHAAVWLVVSGRTWRHVA